MFCSNCGAKIEGNSKFCAECGNKLVSSGQSAVQQRKQETISKVFKIPGLFVTNPLEMMPQINNWLGSMNFSYVNMNLQMDRGQTRQINLTCTKEETETRFTYHMDVIKLTPLQIMASKDSGKMINEWIQKHPNTEIVHQRIVTHDYSRVSEIWFLYKKKK